MNLLKFYGPGQDNPNQLIVQWNLGNTCNYSCEYCPGILHDGSIKWASTDKIYNVLSKIRNYYFNKTVKIEFLGGEVTLKSDFIEIMTFCKELKIQSLIMSNGSRTIDYWSRLAPNLDMVILTYHPQYANIEHFTNVIKILYDHNIDPIINFAMTQEHFTTLLSYKDKLLKSFPSLRIDLIALLDKENRFNYKGFYYEYNATELEFFRQHEHGIMKYFAEYDNGQVLEYSIHEVREKGLDNFTGFTCGTTDSIITIDFFGRASTSLCSQRPRSNINDEDFDKLFLPVICELEKCKNPSDIRILKIKK